MGRVPRELGPILSPLVPQQGGDSAHHLASFDTEGVAGHPYSWQQLWRASYLGNVTGPLKVTARGTSRLSVPGRGPRNKAGIGVTFFLKVLPGPLHWHPSAGRRWQGCLKRGDALTAPSAGARRWSLPCIWPSVEQASSPGCQGMVTWWPRAGGEGHSPERPVPPGLSPRWGAYLKGLEVVWDPPPHPASGQPSSWTLGSRGRDVAQPPPPAELPSPSCHVCPHSSAWARKVSQGPT